MLRIKSISRDRGEDTTDFNLLGQHYRLIARPPQLWKYCYWSKCPAAQRTYFTLQSPWLTLIAIKGEP